MKTKTWLIFVLLLFLSACSNPLPEDKLDYTGEWQSKEMALLILADGSMAYKRIKNGTTTSVNGPIKEFQGNNFIVGIGPLTTTFEVSEPPHQVNGNWQMVVDGVRLTRVPEQQNP